MNIGEAARASGVSAKMIRYYEEIGLIAPAARTAAGYRDYGEADVHVLRFIRRARDLGFSVAEIADMLDLWRDRNRQSAEVRRIAENRIAELERRIAQMQDMVGTLRDLVACCHGDERPDCPILERLEADDLTEPPTLEKRTGAVARAPRKTAAGHPEPGAR